MARDYYQTGPSSSDQWLRRWKLVLSGAGDDTVLSQSVKPLPNEPGVSGGDGLKMTFSTVQSRVQTPGSAVITVYNTSLRRYARSLARQYNRVTLFAGYYDGHFGIVFDGTLAYLEQGRDDNLVDTFLRIHAIDGDWPLNATTVNQTFDEGTTEGDKARYVLGEIEKKGARPGEREGLPDVKMPRAHVAFGMATDQLRRIGVEHYIEGGKLNSFDPKRPFGNEGTATVLNSLTGLVNIPIVTADGVELTCLINSDFRLNSLVKVNQEQVNRTFTPFAGQSEGTQGIQRTPRAEGPSYIADVSADGIYAIVSKEYEGDTRGNSWYCHLVLFAANAVARGALGPASSENVVNSPIDIGLGPTTKQIENSLRDETTSSGTTGG